VSLLVISSSSCSSLKPIFQGGVRINPGIRPTLAREGSKLDFVRSDVLLLIGRRCSAGSIAICPYLIRIKFGAKGERDV
jgi:hypothetical protein